MDDIIKADNGCDHEVHPWHHLVLDHVSVRRGGQKIIDDVSFSLSCGDLVALIGPNGGGKSTLLRTILGEWRHEGNITFTDHCGNIVPRPRIGYMAQQLSFDRQAPLTVSDLLLANASRWPIFLGHRRKDRKAAADLLELVDAVHLMDRRLGELSGGELQRVTLAFALDPIPDVLLLDEPVSALDEQGQAVFYQLVSALRDRYDMLTLVVSHDIEVISEFATRLIVLNHTMRASGSTADILSMRAKGGF